MRTSVLITALFVAASLTTAHSDSSIHDWNRLKNIHRIVLAPVVLCTGALNIPAADSSAKEYQQNLRLILHRFDSALTNRLNELPNFNITPMNTAPSKIKNSSFSPNDIYLRPPGKQSRDWPSPDTKKAMILIKKLKVDGIIFSAMREPASIAEGLQISHQTWNINPFNIGLRHIKPHVVSPRVQSILINRSGKIVWQDEELANHPRTKPSTPRTLKADWLDATDIVASLLADSLGQPAPQQ